jgi:hypothetical protein
MHERKRMALEKLVSIPTSTSRQKREKRKTAECAPCRKSLILLVEQRGVEPLTSALRTGLMVQCMLLHAVTFGNIN